MLRGLTLNHKYGVGTRWLRFLEPSRTLESETKIYLEELGFAMVCGKPPLPTDVPEGSSLEHLVDEIIGQIQANPGCGVVLLSGPPGLNSLPWRWLLRSRPASVGITIPPVFIVPSASWFVNRASQSSLNKVVILEGHGRVVKTAFDFHSTPVLESSEILPDTDAAAKQFADLRGLCAPDTVVVDNRCFAGHTARWRGCEWEGNPAVLLLTPCRLLIAPPCEITIQTAANAKLALKVRSDAETKVSSIGLAYKFDSLSFKDPASCIYNLYVTP